MKGFYVVSGGGPAGLVAALTLSEHVSGDRIYLIERAPEAGGLLRGYERPPFGHFDQGMHTFPSSKEPFVNQIVESMLPQEEWIKLHGAARDISGLFFAGRLQHGCHYPDLSALPEAEFQRCLAGFFSNLNGSEANAMVPANMADYALNRFGRPIADGVVDPILTKLFGRPARQIDTVVAQVLPLDRMAGFNERVFADLMKADLMRLRWAYPEQRRLPERFSSGVYSLYPKSFGAHRLVDAMIARLRASGVRIVSNSWISKVTLGDRRVRSATVQGQEQIEITEVQGLYWTAGALPFAKLLGIPGADAFEAPKRFAVVNLLLDRAPIAGDLYYFWCFDPSYLSFRVTLFHNYCPDAVRNGGYPVSVEMYLGAEDVLDEASLIVRAKEELKAFGLLDNSPTILHAFAQILPSGFPILSLRNRALLEETLSRIRSLELGNAWLAGIQSEWGIILQPDVMAQAYRVVMNSLDAKV